MKQLRMTHDINGRLSWVDQEGYPYKDPPASSADGRKRNGTPYWSNKNRAVMMQEAREAGFDPIDDTFLKEAE